MVEPKSPSASGRPGRTRAVLVIAAVVVAAVLAGGAALAFLGGDDAGSDTGAGQTTAVSATTATPTAGVTTSTLPPDEQCTDAIRANPRWVCLSAARVEGNDLVLEYTSSFAGDTPNVNGGYHLHLFPSDGSVDAATMGTQAAAPGVWMVEDRGSPLRLDLSDPAVANVFPRPVGPKVCARIANATHALERDLQGGFATGNCVPVRRV